MVVWPQRHLDRPYLAQRLEGLSPGGLEWRFSPGMTTTPSTRGRKRQLNLVVTGLSLPQTEPELWERQLIEPALVKVLDQPAERPEVGDAADQ